jgi:AcrR family transcriptional regulator
MAGSDRDPRERLVLAMASSIREKGYRDTTVADVVRLARTSRRTFYEHFDDRADCLVALLDLLGERLMAAVAGSVTPSEPWEVQLEHAIDAFLRAWVADPVLSSNLLTDLGADSDRALHSRDAMAEAFARLLVTMVAQGRAAQDTDTVPPLTMDGALFFVAGMRELVVRSRPTPEDTKRLAPLLSAFFKAVLFADRGT